ncbi:MAG: hypothetical protein QOG50_1990 [Actinomycetota bacterium]|nr:hypothetical protein [Actinomycetota bacterium]
MPATTPAHVVGCGGVGCGGLVGAVDAGVVARVVDGTTTDLGAVVVGAIAA